jgi:hypothetical protein
MELILAKKVIPTRERCCARDGRSLIAQLIAGASCDKRGSAPPRTQKGRDNTFTVTVDDQSRQTKVVTPQLGDRAAAWI